jgi:hypothetical protein
MKLKATALLLGLCSVIVTGLSSPVFARSTTAYNSFKVWMADKGQFESTYSCLTEYFGAVVNNCAFPVSLLFDVPVDTAGDHTFTVQDYFEGTDAENTFTCQSYAYNGTGGIVHGSVIKFTGPSQTLETTVSVEGDSSVQLICSDIPVHGGVANLNWNP